MLAYYLKLIPRPYLFLFEADPYAPFLFGSMAIVGIVCLIAGLVLGMKSRERGLLYFGLLAFASYVYLVANIHVWNAGLFNRAAFTLGLDVFIVLQLGLAGYLVYRLENARRPAGLLAVFTITYALGAAGYVASGARIVPRLVEPYVYLYRDVRPEQLSELAVILGPILLIGLIGVVLGIKARKPTLFGFLLIPLTTTIFFTACHSLQVDSVPLAVWALGLIVFFVLQLIFAIYLVYRIKGARLAASLLAAFTILTALWAQHQLLFALTFAMAHEGRADDRPMIVEPIPEAETPPTPSER